MSKTRLYVVLSIFAFSAVFRPQGSAGAAAGSSTKSKVSLTRSKGTKSQEAEVKKKLASKKTDVPKAPEPKPETFSLSYARQIAGNANAKRFPVAFLAKTLYVLEMETAGIASLAAEKGLPLLSLRAISDGPSAPIPFDLAEMMDENANLRTDRLIKAILLHPRILFQSMRMRRNSVVAADYAALALHSALSHLPG